MFHRIKSEVEEEAQDPQVEKPKEPEGKVTEIKMFKPPAEVKVEQETQQAETPSQARMESKTETPTPTQKKDTKEMTNQAEASTAEQSEASAPQEHKPAMEIPTGAYGRTNPASTQRGGYPGAYPGSSYHTPSESPSGNDRTLTIGSGITMSGEIESCENLVVEGTVEAALKGARMLDIAESGVFYGTVEIEEATIAGRFEGDLTVKGRLTLLSTGTITGSVAYGAMEVEAGAVIDGRLTPVSSQSQQQAAEPASRPKTAKVKDAKTTLQEDMAPANTDGELFSDKSASGE